MGVLIGRETGGGIKQLMGRAYRLSVDPRVALAHTASSTGTDGTAACQRKRALVTWHDPFGRLLYGLHSSSRSLGGLENKVHCGEQRQRSVLSSRDLLSCYVRACHAVPCRKSLVNNRTVTLTGRPWSLGDIPAVQLIPAVWTKNIRLRVTCDLRASHAVSSGYCSYRSLFACQSVRMCVCVSVCLSVKKNWNKLLIRDWCNRVGIYFNTRSD